MDASGIPQLVFNLVLAALSTLLCVLLGNVKSKNWTGCAVFQSPFHWSLWQTHSQKHCSKNLPSLIKVTCWGSVWRQPIIKINIYVSMQSRGRALCVYVLQTQYSKKTADGAGLLLENCPWCWKQGKKKLSKDVLALISYDPHYAKACVPDSMIHHFNLTFRCVDLIDLQQVLEADCVSPSGALQARRDISTLRWTCNEQVKEYKQRGRWQYSSVLLDFQIRFNPSQDLNKGLI